MSSSPCNKLFCQKYKKGYHVLSRIGALSCNLNVINCKLFSPWLSVVLESKRNKFAFPNARSKPLRSALLTVVGDSLLLLSSLLIRSGLAIPFY